MKDATQTNQPLLKEPYSKLYRISIIRTDSAVGLGGAEAPVSEPMERVVGACSLLRKLGVDSSGRLPGMLELFPVDPVALLWLGRM